MPKGKLLTKTKQAITVSRAIPQIIYEEDLQIYTWFVEVEILAAYVLLLNKCIDWCPVDRLPLEKSFYSLQLWSGALLLSKKGWKED